MAPNSFNDEIWRMSPEYQRAYEEGFKAAQNIILNQLRKLLKEMWDIEAFATSTATSLAPNQTVK